MTVVERMGAGTYSTIHKWLRDNNKKPSACSFCNGKKMRIEWANITGVYDKNIKNYKALCASCHRRLDGGLKRGYCKYGHRLISSNLYFFKNSNCRQCRTCRFNNRRKNRGCVIFYKKPKPKGRP